MIVAITPKYPDLHAPRTLRGYCNCHRNSTVEPALDRVGDFAAFLDQNFDEAEAYGPLRKAELIGRPVGTAAWIAGMEARTGMALAPGKRGPKPKRDQIV